MARFAVFWILSMLVTAAVVGLALAALLLIQDGAMKPLDDLALVWGFVSAGVGFGMVVLAVLWLPAWFVFALIAALLESLDQQAAATIAAGFLALFVAGFGSLVFGPLFYFSGFVGLVIGPMVAWQVWSGA